MTSRARAPHFEQRSAAWTDRPACRLLSRR